MGFPAPECSGLRQPHVLRSHPPVTNEEGDAISDDFIHAPLLPLHVFILAAAAAPLTLIPLLPSPPPLLVLSRQRRLGVRCQTTQRCIGRQRRPLQRHAEL